MKILCYLILILSFSFSPAYSKIGKGELKLSKNTMQFVMQYFYGAGNPKYSGDDKNRNEPTIMVVSADGRYSYYYYCQFAYKGRCDGSLSRVKALKKCEKLAGSKCFTFAKKYKIVWKNGGPKVKIKRKDLKSPYKVAKMIQDAGFYDGDISKLAGINLNTGQIDEETIITGAKDNKNPKITEDKTKDTVEELENLSKLFESGMISKEEFDKAKKKLLTN